MWPIQKFSRKECMSILGTLQHISFIYKEGHSTLPPLTAFISKFHDDFACHHTPKSVTKSLCWWEAVLNAQIAPSPSCPISLLTLTYGLIHHLAGGLVIVYGDLWYAWSLLPGWKADSRDIGWAESIALELAILVDEGYHNCSIIIRGNNTGVIGAYDKGRSHNIPRNESICHITSSIVPNNILFVPVYMASAFNRADPISHCILVPPPLCGFTPCAPTGYVP